MNYDKTSTMSFPDRKAGKLLSRIAEITILFWILKIMTIGMGEVFADFLNYKLRIDHMALVIGGLVLLTGSLVAQFSFRKDIPWHIGW
jgi:uncharacterized membrane-anchored protein